MSLFAPVLHHTTPEVAVLNTHGQVVREIRYHRHPDTVDSTDERMTSHRYDVRGHLRQSIDPRLHTLMKTNPTVKSNFRYQTSLSGELLKTECADAGTTSLLKDAAGRPVLSHNAEGVITRWHYEPVGNAGRLLYVTETSPDGEENITQRFSYADNTPENRAHNLVGTVIAHYDTAGVKRIDSVSLTGQPLSASQQWLNDGEDADWQGETETQRQQKLAPERYLTETTLDATGGVLTQTDAKGNTQSTAYDIAGMMKHSTLRLKGENRVTDLFQKITYAANGQKQQEIHGNGVVSTYSCEPETQRLMGIKVERPATHSKGAKVFQDLHYTYDPIGNVLSVRNHAEKTRFFRNKKIEPENRYVYDSLYQIIQATGREIPGAGGTQTALPEPIFPLVDTTQMTAYTRTYTYDRGNNLIQVRHHAPESRNSHTTDILISDKSNRGVLKTEGLLPEQVDDLFHAGGHQKELLKGQPLAWTHRGELAKVKMTASDTETYRYDANSQRVTKLTKRQHSGSVHTEKVIYLGNLEIRTRHQDGKLKEELHCISAGNIQFLHWETGKSADIENNQQRHSHGDIINSRGLELDQKGELISQEEYYPYGGTAVWTARSKTEADYKTIRYSGKERDATGLYYYGYRYYQSWTGRWLSSDPAGTVDGLNLYRMVRNNPLRYYDKQGLMPNNNGAKKFKDVFNHDTFGALDDLLKFPEIFIKSDDNTISLSGEIKETLYPEGNNKKFIELTWSKQIVPRFEPRETSEMVEDDALSSESFNKDLHRSRYSISYMSEDSEIPFSEENIDNLLTKNNRKIISTIAHQGHLADVTGALSSIQRVNKEHWFVQKRNSHPEHKIIVGEKIFTIKSRSQFEIKNAYTDGYIDGFYAAIEQVTNLDAVCFDDNGQRLLNYQSEEQASTQRIELHLEVSFESKSPEQKSGFMSRFFGKKNQKEQRVWRPASPNK